MKIRWKLFVALVLVVAGGTAGTLFVAERQFQSWVRAQVLEAFQRDVEGLLDARQERLSEVGALSRKLAGHEVVQRVVTGRRSEVSTAERADVQLAYAAGLREMRREDDDVGGRQQRDLPRLRDQRGVDAPRIAAELPLMGVVNLAGDRVFISKRRGRLASSWKEAEGYFRSDESEGEQVVGYGLLDERTPGASRVKEVVVTPVKVDGEWAGWFFLGRDAGSRDERILAKYGARDSWTGLWVDGEWFAEGETEVDPGLSQQVEALLGGGAISSAEPKLIEEKGVPYLLLVRELNPKSPLGKGYQVALFSLERLDEAVTRLRWGVALLGAVALMLAVVIALWLSSRFSGPILRLVEATEKVREGDLNWKVPVKGKDEFATLATGFNRMTEELSLKERYRDLLSKTSDPVVARRLTEGSLELGGEVRQAAVVFCDIRGFTAMTDGMAPAEVISMLNDHMTAMTRVIHEHGGVVDKFVGDLVMAVFGAPVGRPDDVVRAARCAIEMVRVRRSMNEELKVPVEIGIGLASGEIVSGLMGSQDRLNYTVLGDRVNLAARLCSLAAVGEVLVDGSTVEQLPEALRGRRHGGVEVRGFRSAVEIWSLAIDPAAGDPDGE